MSVAYDLLKAGSGSDRRPDSLRRAGGFREASREREPPVSDVAGGIGVLLVLPELPHAAAVAVALEQACMGPAHITLSRMSFDQVRERGGLECFGIERFSKRKSSDN